MKWYENTTYMVLNEGGHLKFRTVRRFWRRGRLQIYIIYKNVSIPTFFLLMQLCVYFSHRSESLYSPQ